MKINSQRRRKSLHKPPASLKRKWPKVIFLAIQIVAILLRAYDLLVGIFNPRN